MGRLRRHVTYANVVSTLALVFAVGGGGVYAASKISGKTIKKGTLPGNRLKVGSVTGTQVNENRLGIVPSAKSAESAGSAGSAQSAVSAASVNGVSEQVARASFPVSTVLTEVASVDGLRIHLSCAADGTASIGAQGSTASDAGWMYSVRGINDDIAIFLNGVALSTLSTAGSPVGMAGAVTLQRDTGRVVRFDYQLREVTNGFGTSDDCFLSGFFRSAP